MRSFTRAALGSVIQDQRSGHAGRDGHQHDIRTHLRPLLAARREREVMRTPVAHHMLAVAPFGRQALALVEPVVGAGAAGCLRVAMAGGLRLPCLR